MSTHLPTAAALWGRKKHGLFAVRPTAQPLRPESPSVTEWPTGSQLQHKASLSARWSETLFENQCCCFPLGLSPPALTRCFITDVYSFQGLLINFFSQEVNFTNRVNMLDQSVKSSKMYRHAVSFHFISIITGEFSVVDEQSSAENVTHTHTPAGSWGTSSLDCMKLSFDFFLVKVLSLTFFSYTCSDLDPWSSLKPSNEDHVLIIWKQVTKVMFLNSHFLLLRTWNLQCATSVSLFWQWD